MNGNEKYYTVGKPDCEEGCCTPVFVADMTKEEGPLFFVETSRKTELAAELLGVSIDELEKFTAEQHALRITKDEGTGVEPPS
jgi:hypothetical protein